MRRVIWVIFMSFAVVACQSTPAVEEQGTQATLEPAQEPAPRNVGFARVWLVDGKEERRHEIIARTSNTTTWRRGECTWTLQSFGFYPPFEWKNCEEGASGQQTIELVTEPAYPLSVGKKWRYESKGSDDQGNAWENFRACEVKGTARVTAPIGTHDTYKIICDEKWRIRTYYFAPDLDTSILSLVYNKDDRTTEKSELIRIENENRGS